MTKDECLTAPQATAHRRFGETAMDAVPSLPLVTMGLGLCAALACLSPALAQALQFERRAVADGEVFRILACHWTHWSWDHLFWDAMAFAVLGALCERRGRGPFLAALMASTLAIPLACGAFLPWMGTYRGLSGVDSALFGMLGVGFLREAAERRQWAWMACVASVLLAFVAKVIFEAVTGSTVFVDSSSAAMAPVPLAHGVGALAGGLTAFLSPLPAGRRPVDSRQAHASGALAGRNVQRTAGRHAEGPFPGRHEPQQLPDLPPLPECARLQLAEPIHTGTLVT